MRIVIDMQGLQASNSKRGIGRYILNFIKNFIKQNKDNDIILLCNGMLQDSIGVIKDEFFEHVDSTSFRVWHAMPGVSYINIENKSKIEVAERIREDYIARLEPDLVILTSLFEGLVDDAVTSINTYEKPVKTAVILYDLIPLIHSEIYLENPVVKDWYLKKISNLKRADFLLSISHSSGKEAVDYLHFSADKVFNISTAASSFFEKRVYLESEIQDWKTKFSITRKYILYTGGIDFRKNIERLIEAYALLSLSQRKDYQLAIVCSITEQDLTRLKNLCKKLGLNNDEVIFTGYISEEDLLAFYNLCEFFVFPSWHEGFGLPILEAMHCGKAVIGGKYSSIPEVINNEQALFDPYDITSICSSLSKLINDHAFRSELEKHSSKQCEYFSWEQTSNLAWTAINNNINSTKLNAAAFVPGNEKLKKIAYFSPLPPMKSGIAHYSAELLRELSTFYHIDLIMISGEETHDPFLHSVCGIKSIEWFKENAETYDRIVYHFGNSSFHWHMFDLLKNYPGVVVLHDYFLSGIVAHMDLHLHHTVNGWEKELFKSGGWPAVSMRYNAADTADVVYKYPCNISVLQNSLGIITHSEYSRQLAINEYGAGALPKWETIPLLRIPANNFNKADSRKKLGIDSDTLVVCSFGLMGPTKLNKELIKAWIDSPLSKDNKCHLVFAGEKPGDLYGSIIDKLINKCKCNIRVTGWLSNEEYNHWLSAADIGVQLRSNSRGESSAAVLDCMNYGLATIVNANGSMAELNHDCVEMLPDNFGNEMLVQALSKLYNDPAYRSKISKSASVELRKHYHPRSCAERYVSVIEGFYSKPSPQPHDLIRTITNFLGSDDNDYIRVCKSLAKNFEPIPRKRKLFIDISELIQRDAKSGIQRVVREVINNLLIKSPKDYNVELVYATNDSDGFFNARKYGCKILNIPDHWAEDNPIDYYPGDVFLGLDLQPEIVRSQYKKLKEMHNDGVHISYVVYDLLPVNQPQHFFPGAKETYNEWFSKITSFNSVVCISNTVANELRAWVAENAPNNSKRLSIDYFHLGANPAVRTSANKDSDDLDNLISSLKNKNTFLVVSTIEPRKQHAEILKAFEQLWLENLDVNLVFVGKEGWMVEELVSKIKNHPQLDKHFFWFSGIDDNLLAEIYEISTCLICASTGEGFGLPIIEAAQHNLPVLARDIPVFREVGGDAVHYFAGESLEIAAAIKEWISLKENHKIPKIENLNWLTWSQSTEQLINAVLRNVQQINGE
ncbi:glycosyltransferase [Citrobacter braakii]|uniref:glycosyltransferase n=1 Tax=Citrobacter braakii TaxID=57706 RepID=UPI0019062432|nr:glycosyltransferase [Citrobacter braakii]MBJ9027110.1 glycosyltransferase [Citrobacter braakii]